MQKTAMVTMMAMFAILVSVSASAAFDVVGDYTVSGYIGAGTETPLHPLHLYRSATTTTRFRLENGSGYCDFFTSLGGGGMITNNISRLFITNAGRVGLGTNAPGTHLHLYTNTGNAEIIRVQNSEGYGDIKADANTLQFLVSGARGLFLDASGEASVNVLNILGGSDLAELFEVSAPEGVSVQAGMVVSIDPADAGHLLVSDKAYSRTVAGIISGAGGLKPGMMMGQEGSIASGKFPVALTGRVYCFVDASKAPVAPGDLLTTSDLPGHAMKVTDFAAAQGAIIGKAMTGLSEGQGLVLVLVSLQ